jgi:hypothetical protein
MKQLYSIVLFFVANVFVAQNVAINGTGAAPDASAMLDVAATNRGFLPPRVALTAINVAGPITAPATGLIVYNTATAGTSPNDVVPGYYFWDGAKWVRLISNTLLNNQSISAIGKFYSALTWTGNWPNNTFITFTINDPNMVCSGSNASALFVSFDCNITAALSGGLTIRNTRVSAGQFRITVVNQTGATLTGGIPITYVAFY